MLSLIKIYYKLDLQVIFYNLLKNLKKYKKIFIKVDGKKYTNKKII
jgi:hypothetical protein